MFSKLKQKNEGFTIIEVLIVLAIAGMIMLVVFLAVPALQRNSRNSSRKNDVTAILGAVTEFSSNNNGALPAAPADITNNARLGYYTTVALVANGPGPGGQAAIGSDTVRVVTGARCGANGTTVAGGARQIAVQFQNETSSGLTNTCQDA